MPSWESTQKWFLATAAFRPSEAIGAWAGARWEGETGMDSRLSPAAAIEWRRKTARVWAAASRGYGEAAYPTTANDFRTLALQGLGLLERGGSVTLPEARRAELGAALGNEQDRRWVRAVLFATDLKRAFLGSSLEAIGVPDAIVGDGALDSLRADARTIGAELSGRLPLAYGFYARGRGMIVRDRNGDDPLLGAGPSESAIGALGVTRLLFKRDLLANAEIIGQFRGVVSTPFARLDAATLLSLHVTGDVSRRFHLFYELDNLLDQPAASRTLVTDFGLVDLPGRNYSLGVIWRLLD
jgi:hypothetical protein